MPRLKDSTPLSNAIAWVQSRMSRGVKCPCCDQYVKMYERKITAPAARDLIKLYNITDEDEFHHIDEFKTDKAGDFAKLRYWGLIEERLNEDSSKRCSGWWRITQCGIEFVDLTITVPRKVRIYNSEFHGYVDNSDRVGINDCLGTKFHYGDLMAGR